MATQVESQIPNFQNLSNLDQFVIKCVVGESLIKFRDYMFSTYPDYSYNPFDLIGSYKDLFKTFTERFQHIAQHFTKFPGSDGQLFKEYASSDNIGPYTFTQALFYPAITLLGTDKQVEHWTKIILDFRITASYAQTEIAHGSDVQGLQTTATYDHQKRSFVLNTPSAAAVKFWPGGLGCVCTHLVTQAQTFAFGKNYGLQTFVIQIRDFKEMKLAKGVDAGDIGPKLGFKSIDNGYLRFDNFEIPYESVLQKYFSIDEKGTVNHINDKSVLALTYGAMMTLRSNLIRYFTGTSVRSMLLSLTHQNLVGFKGHDVRRYLDTLASVYGLAISSQYVRNEFTVFMKYYHSDPKQALKMIKELHFLTSGIKAVSSYEVVRLTRSLGAENPLGNLVLSSFTQAYTDSVPTVTYEGDNTVLYQQVMQVLLLNYSNLRSGKRIQGIASFLNNYKVYAEEDKEMDQVVKLNSGKDVLASSDTLMDNMAFKLLQYSLSRFQKTVMEDGVNMKIAMADHLQVPLIKLGKVFFDVCYIKMIQNVLSLEPNKKFLEEKNQVLLDAMCKLLQINLFTPYLSLALELRIVEPNENIEKYIIDAKEEIYKLLEPRFADLFRFEGRDVKAITDYKNLDHPRYHVLKDQMERNVKEFQGSILRQSKL